MSFNKRKLNFFNKLFLNQNRTVFKPLHSGSLQHVPVLLLGKNLCLWNRDGINYAKDFISLQDNRTLLRQSLDWDNEGSLNNNNDPLPKEEVKRDFRSPFELARFCSSPSWFPIIIIRIVIRTHNNDCWSIVKVSVWTAHLIRGWRKALFALT